MEKSIDDVKKEYEQKRNFVDSFNSQPKVLKLKKGQKEVNLTVISNLFLGDPYRTLRLNKLLQNIKETNADPNGLFIIGGNIFFYVTDEILYLAKHGAVLPCLSIEEHQKYIWPTPKDAQDADLSQKKEKTYEKIRKYLMNKALENATAILKQIDPKKIVGIYPTGSESDRYNKKYAWIMNKKLAKNLGIEDLFFDKDCEINFVFNNSWTDNKNCYFPILATNSHVIKKVDNFSLANLRLNNINTRERGKSLIIDTGSAQAFGTTNININPLNVETSQLDSLTKISVPGYCDDIGKSHYDINPFSTFNTDNFKICLSVRKDMNIFETERNSLKKPTFRNVVEYKDFGLKNNQEFNFDLMAQLNDIIALNSSVENSIVQKAKKARTILENRLISTMIANNRKYEKPKTCKVHKVIKNENDGGLLND